MRQVAVTEGGKVEAQIKFGWSINGYGIGDVVQRMKEVSDSEVKQLLGEYAERYEISEASRNTPAIWDSIAEQARIELGMKAFLEEGGFTAFTTTFEDLHGMKQLPGLAVQRLMEQGYGFAGEGDWKTAALTRMIKTIAGDKKTSFMEDYIGGKADPARIVFDGLDGAAVKASLVDMGNRFRLIISEVDAVKVEKEMPT